MFSNHDMVKPDTIIEVWKKENWESVVDAVTKAGLRTIVSSPWYLNYISYGSDSMKIYLEDPQAFGGTEEQERLVVGGEVSVVFIIRLFSVNSQLFFLQKHKNEIRNGFSKLEWETRFKVWLDFLEGDGTVQGLQWRFPFSCPGFVSDV